MQGFVETIFKTRPDIVVPLLQRYIKIEDRKAAEELHALHAPVFQKVPRPLFPGMQIRCGNLLRRSIQPRSLKEPDLADLPFTNALKRSGFVDRLTADQNQADRETIFRSFPIREWRHVTPQRRGLSALPQCTNLRSEELATGHSLPPLPCDMAAILRKRTGPPPFR
jgi:hypothetical protein